MQARCHLLAMDGDVNGMHLLAGNFGWYAGMKSMSSAAVTAHVLPACRQVTCLISSWLG